MQGTQDRQSVRIPVDFPVEMRYQEEICSARALNMSVGGMLIKTHRILVENEMLHLVFHLPGCSTQFQLLARVAWSKLLRTERGNVVCALGVQYLGISLPACKLLESFIRRELDRERDLIANADFGCFTTEVYRQAAL